MRRGWREGGVEGVRHHTHAHAHSYMHTNTYPYTRTEKYIIICDGSKSILGLWLIFRIAYVLDSPVWPYSLSFPFR